MRVTAASLHWDQDERGDIWLQYSLGSSQLRRGRALSHCLIQGKGPHQSGSVAVERGPVQAKVTATGNLNAVVDVLVSGA